ncbi:MAG TPA: RDD family protein, partial [Frankiaceae bacterium]|nr:RDD family protein [Frankiaceae bacterium]
MLVPPPVPPPDRPAVRGPSRPDWPDWPAGGGRMPPAATFGQRLGARLIDGVLLAALAAGVVLAAKASLRDGVAGAGTGHLVALCVAAVLLPLAYKVAAEGTAAATPGQALLDLRVVRLVDGSRPRAARLLGRALASLVGDLPLGLGSLTMLRDRDRRAWQDRASGTRV